MRHLRLDLRATRMFSDERDRRPTLCDPRAWTNGFRHACRRDRRARRVGLRDTIGYVRRRQSGRSIFAAKQSVRRNPPVDAHGISPTRENRGNPAGRLRGVGYSAARSVANHRLLRAAGTRGFERSSRRRCRVFRRLVRRHVLSRPPNSVGKRGRCACRNYVPTPLNPANSAPSLTVG